MCRKFFALQSHQLICIAVEPRPPPCLVSVDPDWDIVCRDAVTVEVLGFDTERVAAAISATLQLAPPAAPCTFLTLKFLLISEVLEALWSIKVEEGRSVRDRMKERFQAEVVQIPRLFSTRYSLQRIALACPQEFLSDALSALSDYIFQAKGEPFN